MPRIESMNRSIQGYIMETSALLSTAAAILGFIASAFFAHGAIRMNAIKIHNISTTYYDANRPWADSIAEQRADYTVGGSLLLLSFAAQLLAILVPAGTQSSPLLPAGYALSAICLGTLAILLAALRCRSRLAKSTKQEIRQLQEKDLAEPIPKKRDRS